ncbi:hypothetical protein HF521_020620 [Silurus meridionalis]|uniref:Uncharacterized protein n=1 Tax=Silurus meridionalis TaxID=175797 RepID=A0A8T0BE58_SILME|nr:hypothetical protein HF521_020620 [Silurus meridionalis]
MKSSQRQFQMFCFESHVVSYEFGRVVGKISEKTSWMHLTICLQASWTSSKRRKALLVSFWLNVYARQRQLSQLTSDAFVFGDFRSSWAMILLLSSRPALTQLTMTCTGKLQWDCFSSVKRTLS